MKDKELKKDMLENGIYKEMRTIKRKYYFEYKNEKAEEEREEDKIWQILDERLKKEYGEEKYIAFKQLKNSDKEQVRKLKKHIRYLINRDDEVLYFITFSINDNYMNKVKESTIKRKFIALLGDENISDYIINVDYGEQHDRLHYHAIVSIKKANNHLMKKVNGHLKFEPWQKLKIDEKVGHYDVKKIQREFRNDLGIDEEEYTIMRLSRYMTKLVMHSIKEKQSYISVKKGSEYQKFKKLIDEYMKIVHIKSMKTEKRIKEIRHELNENLKGANVEKTIKNLKNIFGDKIQINE